MEQFRVKNSNFSYGFVVIHGYHVLLIRPAQNKKSGVQTSQLPSLLLTKIPEKMILQHSSKEKTRKPLSPTKKKQQLPHLQNYIVLGSQPLSVHVVVREMHVPPLVAFRTSLLTWAKTSRGLVTAKVEFDFEKNMFFKLFLPKTNTCQGTSNAMIYSI